MTQQVGKVIEVHIIQPRGPDIWKAAQITEVGGERFKAAALTGTFVGDADLLWLHEADYGNTWR